MAHLLITIQSLENGANRPPEGCHGASTPPKLYTRFKESVLLE
jgi:hypothetical protein